MRLYGKLLVTGIFPLLMVLCCASYSDVGPSGLTFEEQGLSDAIVETARSLVGKEQLNVNGKKFNVDCTGGVMASYYGAGIDLWPIMAPYKGRGVVRLFNALKERGLIHRSSYPVPGDLIFWDNTWDRNGNGLTDDRLTHVGLVISSDSDGNIEYFHHHIRLGYVIEKMNLLRPDVFYDKVNGKNIVVNNAMRAKGLDKTGGWLAAQLCKGFGQAWLTALEQEKKSAF